MLSVSSFEQKKIECTWRWWFTCPDKKKKKEKNFHVYIGIHISSNSDFFLNLKFFFKIMSTIVYRELVGRNIKFFIQDIKKNVIIS